MKKTKKKAGALKKLLLTVFFGILCGAGLFFVPKAWNVISEKKAKTTEEKPTVSAENKSDEKQGKTQEYSKTPVSETDVSAIYDNVIASVVEVTTEYNEVYDFFGRAYEESSIGRGSGFIAAQQNRLYILTNNHVVEGASVIQVKFFDGTVGTAKLLGTDESNDVAVLTVEYSDMQMSVLDKLKVVRFGDSEKLKVGERVIAIGNALGTGNSLTVGYVSALNRNTKPDDAPGGASGLPLIQTDTAINPGNSGGPLFNMLGEVIGINNGKLSETDVEGICYALPINEVLPIANRLINRVQINKSESASLEFSGRDVSESLSESLNLPMGIYITDYEEDSPLAKAGVLLNSFLTEVNDISVKNLEQLADVLLYIPGGSEGTVTVLERHNGKYEEKVYTVVFGKYSEKRVKGRTKR